MMSIVLAVTLLTVPAAPAQSWCTTAKVTGYVRGDGSPWTADGTSVWSRENIAAASYDVPMHSHVWVEGVGSFVVRDRGGGLFPTHIDVLVDTYARAYEITGEREVCVG